MNIDIIDVILCVQRSWDSAIRVCFERDQIGHNMGYGRDYDKSGWCDIVRSWEAW